MRLTESAAPREALRVTRRSLARGETIAPTDFVLLPADEALTLTLTVDDPTAEPPTDAKVELVVQANDGAGWHTVSTTWGGTSGVMTSVVPIRGRRLRWRVRADAATTVDVAGTAV